MQPKFRLPLIFGAAACCGTLASCGTTLLSSRSSNPVIQDFNVSWWSPASTLSTTASRRLALMVYGKHPDGSQALLTCAEPPPDVGETFAKAIAAQLEVSAPVGGASGPTVSAGGGFAERVATAIAPLMVRTQGLQVLRDSAYTLCIDHLNGWISNEDYLKTKNDRFDKAMTLIATELSYQPRRIDPPPTVAAPALPPAVSAPRPTASSPASTAAEEAISK